MGGPRLPREAAAFNEEILIVKCRLLASAACAKFQQFDLVYGAFDQQDA